MAIMDPAIMIRLSMVLLMPTAPVAKVPSWLTKKVSARLYTLVTSMAAMVGTAMRGMRRCTGVVSIKVRFSSGVIVLAS